MSASDLAYLHQYLQPLQPWLTRDDITDIYINRPGELWIEGPGPGIEPIKSDSLDPRTMERLARQIAAFTHQGISREHPLLSATLPDGARVQVILPPATRGSVAMAIRKHLVMDRTLADYEDDGAFGELASPANARTVMLADLASRLKFSGPSAMLAEAVRARANILIAGGTSTGKSTFLNALIREIPADQRLIFIEDTPELKIHHANAVGLLAARSQLGESSAASEDLLGASLRMRPDRIILGEIRGSEAFTFLRAINTGHPGSMTTIHADSPERAIEQLALLVLQTGTQLRRQDVIEYVSSTIDVFVQLDRHDGIRSVSQVTLAGAV